MAGIDVNVYLHGNDAELLAAFSAVLDAKLAPLANRLTQLEAQADDRAKELLENLATHQATLKEAIDNVTPKK